MTGTDDIDHVQIVVPDQPIEVHVDEVEPGRGAPMAEQTRLDVLELQGNFEQRVILQIDLADREVVGGAPIGVHFRQQVGREHARGCGSFHGLVHGNDLGSSSDRRASSPRLRI
jgi:hypothetical protein